MEVYQPRISNERCLVEDGYFELVAEPTRGEHREFCRLSERCGGMEFLEPRGLRFERALERFFGGRSMAFCGVNFWLAPDGYLEVRVHPDWRVGRDDDQRSLDDMSFARGVSEEISAGSPRFASAAGNLPWRFVKLDETGTGRLSVLSG